MSSTDAPSDQARTPVGDADTVLERARARLLEESSGARDLRPVADACLDVTLAHPSGQAHLLASGRQNLSGLVRDPDARAVALGRLRRFREVVGALEDRGLSAGHLVAGVVVLPGGAELPVLVRSCRVSGAGEGDASVVVDGAVQLNPALVREVARRSGGALDLPAVLGQRLRTKGNGFDPYPLLDLVQAGLPAVPGAVLRRRLLLAPLSMDTDRVVSDLDGLRGAVPEHSPLAWVGEDWDVEAAKVLARAGEDLPGAPEPDVAVSDLLDRYVPTKLDPDQRRVLTAVLAGHSIAVDAPPGTGATTCAVAVAAVAAATGRRCLVVVPTRAEGVVLLDRLVGLGLGDLVADGSGTLAASPEAAAALATTRPDPDAPAAADPEDTARRHQEAGERYHAAVAELRRVRRPWQVTRADVLEVLAAAEVEGPRVSDVVLEQDQGTALSLEQLEALADDLAEAVGLGALDVTRSAWTGARITDRQGAQEALGLVRRLRDGLVEEARTAADELATGTGTVRAVTVAEITDRHRLFTGLQTTLDRLVDEVFDVPVLDLVAATADPEFRRTTDYTISGPTRWRLRRRARRLIRPGVEVDDQQLHRLLAAAAAQRLDWQTISEGSGWAHLPAATGAMVARLGDLVRACERLDLLHPGLRLAAGTLEDVQDVVARLDADADALQDLPRRTLLEQRVSERGGAALLARLRRLPTAQVSPSVAARELSLAWWLGVALATAPATSLLGATTEAAARYAASQQDWVAAAATRVRAARAAVDPRLLLPDPVRVLVPADVADLPADEHIDVVVLDDAGRTGLAEVCGALARTAQVVALADVGVARPGSAATVLADCLPLDRLRTSHRTHDPVLAAVATATGSSPVGTTGSPDADRAVTRTFLDGAVGLPGGAEDRLDTTEVEVDHVVREVLRLVVDLAAQDPPRSVAVVALTRTHAAAVAAGVRRAVRTYPALADAFSPYRPEPVVVASVDQTRGLERDEVLLCTGFARTPHGRVVHRFGPLDAPGGAGLLSTAVSRARHRLHVVTALRVDDLDPSRLRTPGAQALAATLQAVEAAASGEGVAGVPAAPVVTDLSDRSAVLQVLARELVRAGAEVVPGPSGGLGVTYGTQVLVVDVDVSQPDPAAVAGRRASLVEAGWEHQLVAAELVAADVAGVAASLLGLLDDAHDPGADANGADANGADANGADVNGADVNGADVNGADVNGADANGADASGADASGADASGADTSGASQPGAAQPGGTGPDAAATDAATPGDARPPAEIDLRAPSASSDPVVPQVSADDTDRGWGERAPEDDDDRILRERPPHW